MSFKITKNYIVINIHHLIICFDFEDIDQMNEAAN